MAKLKRDVTCEKGVLSFSLSGQFYGGSGNPKLVDTITKAVEQAKEQVTKVIINLENMKWISAPGLALMVTLRSILAKQGITVRLEKPNAKVLAVLRVTRLDMIFEVIE